MEEVPEHGVLVDRCSSCRGVWFDRGELEAAIEAEKERAGEPKGAGDDLWSHLPGVDGAPAPESASPSPPRQEVVYRQCPRCKQTMLRRNYKRVSGVIIDVCGAHGAYLDEGELAQLVAFEKNPPPAVEPAEPSAAAAPRPGYVHESGSGVGWVAADVGVDVVATVIGAVFFDW